MKKVAKKPLIIGTTADYIELLAGRFPDRAVFVTDIKERKAWKGKLPSDLSEILLDLGDQNGSVKALEKGLNERGIAPSGIVCFDCESMALASIIAAKFGLPFPSLEAIINCRSKYRSKKIWEERNVPCPDAGLIYDEEGALRFFDSLKGETAVMKPLTGSGSELVILCGDAGSCRSGYRMIRERLKEHLNSRMYTALNMPEDEDPINVVVMERYIPGEEYSCDFVIESGRAEIIRLARKTVDHDLSFGTVTAYVLQDRLPGGWSLDRLERRLKDASESLGFDRAIAMADLKIYDNEVFLLEITPRPGGDCLPPLIMESSGFDILKEAINFSERKKVTVPPRESWKEVVGFHLISSRQGVLKRLDKVRIEKDPRVVCCHFRRSPGDIIKLPPEDYGSRILGHVIFRPDKYAGIEAQCREISERLIVEME